MGFNIIPRHKYSLSKLSANKLAAVFYSVLGKKRILYESPIRFCFISNFWFLKNLFLKKKIFSSIKVLLLVTKTCFFLNLITPKVNRVAFERELKHLYFLKKKFLAVTVLLLLTKTCFFLKLINLKLNGQFFGEKSWCAGYK